MAFLLSALPYVALGFVSLLLQITLLRELLTVFSGNELDIGITLSVWLVSVGLGSMAGSRVGSRRAFGLSFLFVAALAMPSLVGVKLIRPALGLELGETASLVSTFLSTLAVLMPVCFCLGLQFPLAVSRISGRLENGPSAPAPAVYGLEALGAVFAGLVFTFLLSGRVSPQDVTLAVSVLYVVLGFYLVRSKWVVAALLIPAVFYIAFLKYDKAPVEGARVVRKVQSRYGEIVATRLKDQFNLYAAGHYLFTYPNPQSDEVAAHLPMTIRAGAERVISIGGSPAIVSEIAKYNVEGVDFVEMDPVLVEVSTSLLEGRDRAVLEDERVRVITRDGRRYIKSLGAPTYDLAILRLSPPSTANMNRFYTVEFFRELRAVLREGGVAAVFLPTSSGYVGRRMMLANGTIFSSLRAVFSHVRTSTEEYGLVIASDSEMDTLPENLARRFEASGVRAESFHPYIFEDAFFPLRALLHGQRLARVEELNTDSKPTAYLYNLMLWAEVHDAWALNAVLGLGGWSAIILMVVLALPGVAAFRRRSRALYYSMLTTGYAAMAFTVALMLGYQASFGYVYEMFGLLSALFMVGVYGGSYILRKVSKAMLFILEVLTALFAVSATLLFSSEPMFYAFALAAGLLTGCQFAEVNRLAGNRPHEGGVFYAVDLAGSFLGAFLSSIVLVPLVGIGESLLLVAGMKVLSGAIIILLPDE